MGSSKQFLSPHTRKTTSWFSNQFLHKSAFTVTAHLIFKLVRDVGVNLVKIYF